MTPQFRASGVEVLQRCSPTVRAVARWDALTWCRPLYPMQSVAACLFRKVGGHPTRSRETIYCASIRAAAELAAHARKEADRLAVEAWNKRMLGFQGPAQPSPTLGDALNAGYGYLEVRCLGCDTHQTVALAIVRRPKATPIHELKRYMRCKDCSQCARRRSPPAIPAFAFE
jgi:hypothetical protein